MSRSAAFLFTLLLVHALFWAVHLEVCSRMRLRPVGAHLVGWRFWMFSIGVAIGAALTV